MPIVVRIAREEELEQVNVLRREVNDLHVSGRPDVFRPGFDEELRRHVYDKYHAQDSDVLAAFLDGVLCGFAVVEYKERPQTPFSKARRFYHVEEFGVAESARRKGVATALVSFMKEEAKKRGFPRIELDMWEFNGGARAFYESAGFQTTRRYMELEL